MPSVQTTLLDSYSSFVYFSIVAIGEECPAYVVVAGCEPCQFTTLFPFWTDTKVATNVDIVRWKHLVCNAFFVY
jgi:hypothetical protein